MSSNKEAIVSPDGKYRYSLTRKWGEGRCLLFIMLNPSTADSTIDDPTIKKCEKYAKREKFKSMCVVNLYAYRSTDPSIVMRMGLVDAEGPDNESHIISSILLSDAIICAWGKHGGKGTHKAIKVLSTTDKEIFCLDINKDGSPKHPLYCKDDIKFKKYLTS